MRRNFLLGIFIVLFFGLTACSINRPTEPDVIDSGNNLDGKENKQYENSAFKEVTVSKSNGKLIVKGKARVFEGVFQYAVISETEILLEDHYQTDGAPAWGNFEIPIGEELLDKGAVKIELFVYSAKDGSKTDILTIPLK